LTPDPTILTGEALLELVKCPPKRNAGWHAPLVWWTPREQTSPSALQTRAACQRSWGHTYLEGRREPSLEWSVAERIPEPAKAERGCSALAKDEAAALKRAWNKVRRPALGHEAHALLAAWVTQHATPGVEGAWHPPMAWREIDWHSAAGRVAQPATGVLPDPRTLAAVHTELAAECEAPIDWIPGRDGPWPKMPGYYDLVTVERVALPLSTGAHSHRLRYRLWDYKTTSSFDWAKTEEELREDPQVLLYALHAMQTFDLQEIECSWIYLLTDPTKQPKSYVVSVTVTRAEAEAAVLELAHSAAEAIDQIRQFKAGRLRVVDLPQDISACKAYGGCVYHESKGGPCAAKVSPGLALRQAAALDEKIKARKSARKETERSMAETFEEKQAKRAAAKAAEAAAKAAAAGGASEPVTAEEQAPASVEEKPIQTTVAPKAKPVTVPTEGVHATVDGFAFAVPAGSALAKALSKAAKGLQAAAAAFEGE
jgi:hypothetical protein